MLRSYNYIFCLSCRHHHLETAWKT